MEEDGTLCLEGGREAAEVTDPLVELTEGGAAEISFPSRPTQQQPINRLTRVPVGTIFRVLHRSVIADQNDSLA